MIDEVWRDIPGYENLYQVSDIGNIRSLGNGSSPNSKPRLLNLKHESNGYIRICLQKNGKRKYLCVHRLVGFAFINNPEDKPCINHIDYVRSNNIVSNLEWCTYSENAYHSSENLSRKGTQNGCCKLKEHQVIEIRDKYKNSSLNQVELSGQYNVSASLISQIVLNKIWSHIN